MAADMHAVRPKRSVFDGIRQLGNGYDRIMTRSVLRSELSVSPSGLSLSREQKKAAATRLEEIYNYISVRVRELAGIYRQMDSVDGISQHIALAHGYLETLIDELDKYPDTVNAAVIWGVVDRENLPDTPRLPQLPERTVELLEVLERRWTRQSTQARKLVNGSRTWLNG